jgi:NAD(P)-dependent dehydrogenase (short-subunit alcohol dehydrogenase family)
MARRLDGKVVLVTGANQGIGYKASEVRRGRALGLNL